MKKKTIKSNLKLSFKIQSLANKHKRNNRVVLSFARQLHKILEDPHFILVIDHIRFFHNELEKKNLEALLLTSSGFVNRARHTKILKLHNSENQSTRLDFSDVITSLKQYHLTSQLCFCQQKYHKEPVQSLYPIRNPKKKRCLH